MKKIIFILLFIFATNINALDTSSINILSSIPPQKYLLKKLLKNINNNKIYSVIKKGENPEFFKPKPSLISLLEKTNIYFSISLPFESLYLSKLNKKALLVDTSKNTDFLYINKKHHKLHKDPHIWLSPNSLKKQILIIKNVLVKKFPKEKNIIIKNKRELLFKLENAIRIAKKTLLPYKNKSILVFHPAFAYYLKYFNLKQISIQKGHKISYKILNNLDKITKQNKIKTMFIQDTRQTTQIQDIAKKLKLKLVKLSSMTENPIQNIIDIAKKIKENTDE